MSPRLLVLLGLLCGAARLGAQGTCYTSDATWPDLPIPAQTDTFTVTYDDTPNAAGAPTTGLDGHVGLSQVPSTGYTQWATTVRFNTANRIDAMDSTVYRAATVLAYTPGTRYHVRMAVNVKAHRYSVWVTPAGGAEILLAANYRFRAAQAMATSLAYWGWHSQTATATHTVCNFTVVAAPPPPPPPSLNVTVAPAVLDFGYQTVGSTSGERAVTLTNTGPDTLRFTGGSHMVGDSLDFAYQGDNCGPPVGAGFLPPTGSCVLRYAFQPRIATARTSGNDVGTSRGFVHVGLAGLGQDSTAPPPPPPPDTTTVFLNAGGIYVVNLLGHNHWRTLFPGFPLPTGRLLVAVLDPTGADTVGWCLCTITVAKPPVTLIKP